MLVYKKPSTDLASLLAKKRVTFTAQKDAIVGLVRCVAALHSKRLVHCGLSPSSLVRISKTLPSTLNRTQKATLSPIWTLALSNLPATPVQVLSPKPFPSSQPRLTKS